MARSEDSEGTTNRACNTGRDNKRGQVQYMDDAQTLFSLNDADGLSGDDVSTILMSMRSVCAVSRPVIRNVLRSQPVQQSTRWMSRLPQATC